MLDQSVTSGTGLTLNPDAGIPMPECRCRADSVDYRTKCRCRTDFFLTLTVNSQNKGAQSGTGMSRYRTKKPDAGMPMPAASDSMPISSYVKKTHI